MRQVIGIGETILDIIFHGTQPTAAVPGGSVFNGAVSLARLGLPVTMLTETGDDRVGRLITDFMRQSGIDASHVAVSRTGHTAVSLAFLAANGDADYTFYKDYPSARFETEWPGIAADDVVMMGSYFVLNPVLRPRVRDFLDHARRHGALIYYDLNYRATHAAEAAALMSDVAANLDYADIVRGSTEDFRYLFGTEDARRVYAEHVAPHCAVMVATAAGEPVRLFPGTGREPLTLPVERVETVSTIGAGDNFNAGTVYGLIREGVTRATLPATADSVWRRIIRRAVDLASTVCQQYGNSVSREWAAAYKER